MSDKKVSVRYTEDEDYVSQMIHAVKENDGYCPCRPNKTDDTKCMCREFREQIKRKELGRCHCGLYEVYEDQ